MHAENNKQKHGKSNMPSELALKALSHRLCAGLVYERVATLAWAKHICSTF
jgi:hypothetical protein